MRSRLALITWESGDRSRRTRIRAKLLRRFWQKSERRAAMSIFATLSVYHDIASRSAALNMAIDEALLETAENPTIRFYKWDHPALSFGYFGRFADVADQATERDLVRRWTGGGIVFHGGDLTYSIAIPASAPAFSESSRSIYEKVHGALRAALIVDGQNVQLAANG